MYKYQSYDDENIILHDCYVSSMSIEGNVLSLVFNDGFYVIYENAPAVRTGKACMKVEILDMDIFGISIYMFVPQDDGKVIRAEWEINEFIDAVNSCVFRLELVDEYKGYNSRLYKCYAWSDTEPYHCECEISFSTESMMYMWIDCIDNV